jgi:hypothetical protein
MSKDFDKMAQELLNDIQFYQNEDSGEFIFGSTNMKRVL